MGLFSNRQRRTFGSATTAARAQEPVVEAESAPATAADRAPSPALPRAAPLATATGLAALREGLQQLYAQRPAHDRFVAEAIALVARAANIKAAALLGYDAHRDSMRLLAHLGLQADALTALSGEAVTGWDIPLRSLRNRRINVIESAHENPFVPGAFVAISPRRLSITALPFFHANAPVGAAVLFSPNARGFPDGVLTGLSQALRVCALALNELPRKPAAPAASDDRPADGSQPSLLRGLATLKAELARLTAALEAAERERDSEAAERVTAQSFLAAAEERGAKLEQEVAVLRAAQTRLPTLEEEIQTLTARLAEATDSGAAALAQVEHLRERIAAHEQRATAHDAAMAEFAAERQKLEEQLTAARVYADDATELQRRVAELAAQASQLSELRDALGVAETAHAASSTLVAQLRDELRDAQQQREAADSALIELRAELDTSTAAHQHVVRELAEKDLLLQSAEDNLGAFDLDLDVDDADTVLAIQRDTAPAEAALLDEEEVAAALEHEDDELIVFDDGLGAAQTAVHLGTFGHRAAALPATAESMDHLRGRHVLAAAVNVAGTAAWSMLRDLRNGSGIARMPLVAYAMPADAQRGFWLGAVDFAVLPVAQLPLASLLASLVPKVKRVIAMSSDIDVMSDVRAKLTGTGISTAVVLDGRQALDLLPTIRPEAAVLHCSPGCTDLFRVVAGIRSAELTRTIPILFLLDAAASPNEEAFFSLGVRTLVGRGDLTADSLAGALATALDPYRA